MPYLNSDDGQSLLCLTIVNYTMSPEQSNSKPKVNSRSSHLIPRTRTNPASRLIPADSSRNKRPGTSRGLSIVANLSSCAKFQQTISRPRGTRLLYWFWASATCTLISRLSPKKVRKHSHWKQEYKNMCNTVAWVSCTVQSAQIKLVRLAKQIEYKSEQIK